MKLENSLPTELHWTEFDAPFAAGEPEPQTGLPLDRFLPPYFPGRVSAWVNNYAPPGSWILDPFGQDPFAILELARAGYRVLVTSNNPISSFILRGLAVSPPSAEWEQALKTLGDIRMPNGVRLEDYIRSFYTIDCPEPDCQGKADITSFIWEEDLPQAASALVHCPECDLYDEVDLDEEMLSQLPPLPSYTANRARALEQSSRVDDPLRKTMEEVVGYYSPRALVLLQVMLARIQSGDFSDRERNLMHALVLSASDQLNQLWAYPLGRNRPKQLIRPPVGQEIALWEALKRARSQWDQLGEPVYIREWPQLPPQKGGIALFNGRLRELDPRPDPHLFSVVFASLPRRNQAYWHLSGLWSGWLWGPKAVEPLRNSLLRQRYDWTWHAKALWKVLSLIGDVVSPTVPILSLIGETDTKFIIAGTLAAQDAGFRLRSAALDGEDISLQTTWEQDTALLPQPDNTLQAEAKASAVDFLLKNGEPVPFLSLFSHMLLTLQRKGHLAGQPDKQPNKTINELEDQIESVLTDDQTFARFFAGASIDTGLYWLQDPPDHYISLTDRVEQNVLAFLRAHGTASMAQINEALHAQLRGLFTPDPETILEVLESYADPVEGEPNTWRLKERESIARRQADTREMQTLVADLATRLKYNRTITPEGIFWKGETNATQYAVFTLTTAAILPFLLNEHDKPGVKILLLPGSRATLLTYKLKKDPNLETLLTPDWHVIKFQQLRNLSENPLLNRELFASQIVGELPEDPSSQMALF